jgi:hypothetical protein
MLIEEKAEGGDMLARISRERPGFLRGYDRVCEGAGLALYRRAEGLGLRADDAGRKAESSGLRAPNTKPSALSPLSP